MGLNSFGVVGVLYLSMLLWILFRLTLGVYELCCNYLSDGVSALL